MRWLTHLNNPLDPVLVFKPHEAWWVNILLKWNVFARSQWFFVSLLPYISSKALFALSFCPVASQDAVNSTADILTELFMWDLLNTNVQDPTTTCTVDRHWQEPGISLQDLQFLPVEELGTWNRMTLRVVRKTDFFLYSILNPQYFIIKISFL